MSKSFSMVQVEYLSEITTYKPVASETDGNKRGRLLEKCTGTKYFFFLCVM